MTRERSDGWGIEYTRPHGPNMVRYKIVTGLTWTPLVGAYLPPLALENLPDLHEALQRFRDLIFIGGLNVDLDKSRSSQIQHVLDLGSTCRVRSHKLVPTLPTVLQVQIPEGSAN